MELPLEAEAGARGTARLSFDEARIEEWTRGTLGLTRSPPGVRKWIFDPFNGRYLLSARWVAKWGRGKRRSDDVSDAGPRMA